MSSAFKETKTTDAEFPGEGIRKAGYHAVWRGEKRWNGVAILARWAPIVTRMRLPGDPADTQCRYIEAAVNGVLIASIYAPNGNPQPGPKFDYKLAWLKRLVDHTDGRSGRSRGRLQRRADEPRHLPHKVLGLRRAPPAGKPSRLSPASRSGLD